MTRKEANQELLKKLEWFIEKCPDQRFGQIITNFFFPKYNICDPFFEESTETLEKVQNIINIITDYENTI